MDALVNCEEQLLQHKQTRQQVSKLKPFPRFGVEGRVSQARGDKLGAQFGQAGS